MKEEHLKLWSKLTGVEESDLNENSNDVEIGFYKTALQAAMETCLNSQQRRTLYRHYWQHMSKTEIGRQDGVEASTVCKRIQAAQNILRDYVGFFMEVHMRLRREHDMDCYYCPVCGNTQIQKMYG